MKNPSKTMRTLSKLAMSGQLSDVTNISHASREEKPPTTSMIISAPESPTRSNLPLSQGGHNVVEYHPDEYAPLKPEEADESELAKLLLISGGFSSFLFNETPTKQEMIDDDDLTIQMSNHSDDHERRRIQSCVRASRYHRGKSLIRQLSSDDEDDERNYASNGHKRIRISE